MNYQSHIKQSCNSLSHEGNIIDEDKQILLEDIFESKVSILEAVLNEDEDSEISYSRDKDMILE